MKHYQTVLTNDLQYSRIRSIQCSSGGSAMKTGSELPLRQLLTNMYWVYMPCRYIELDLCGVIIRGSHGLTNCFQTMKMMEDLQTAPIISRPISKPDRCAIEMDEVRGRNTHVIAYSNSVYRRNSFQCAILPFNKLFHARSSSGLGFPTYCDSGRTSGSPCTKVCPRSGIAPSAGAALKTQNHAR